MKPMIGYPIMGFLYFSKGLFLTFKYKKMKRSIILLMMLTFTAVSFAQTAKDKVKQDSSIQVIYTCPTHADVVSDKPGKCPKCGMDLVKKQIKQPVSKVLYTCPMHPDVISDKPGICPKCGMTLVKKK
jgi:hypothetical protein